MNSDNIWLDPLYLDDLLNEEEKSIRKTAHDYCNKSLLTRVVEDNRKHFFDKNIYKQKMNKTFEALTKDLSALRTGRANASMLDVIKVDVYGQKIPINQLGTITVPDPRTLNIQVWDQNNVMLIDSSIRKSEMGLNPQIDGRLIRIPIPNLNEERRNELKKIVKNMAEKSKISVRNIRREANDVLKAMLKEKKISEDENNKFEKEIQKITDQEIKKIDEKESQKEKEIMTV